MCWNSKEESPLVPSLPAPPPHFGQLHPSEILFPMALSLTAFDGFPFPWKERKNHLPCFLSSSQFELLFNPHLTFYCFRSRAFFPEQVGMLGLHWGLHMWVFSFCSLHWIWILAFLRDFCPSFSPLKSETSGPQSPWMKGFQWGLSAHTQLSTNSCGGRGGDDTSSPDPRILGWTLTEALGSHETSASNFLGWEWIPGP